MISISDDFWERYDSTHYRWGCRWTTYDDILLVELLDDRRITYEDAAEVLGRTYNAVRTRYRFLKGHGVYKKSQPVQVRCIETGEVFESINAVIRSYGLSRSRRGTFVRALNNGGEFLGRHYERT